MKIIKFKGSKVNNEMKKVNIEEVAFPDGSWYRLDGKAGGGKGTYGVRFDAPIVLKP